MANTIHQGVPFRVYRSGGALAGCWWNPKAEQLCPDLSPQGYLIYRVMGIATASFSVCFLLAVASARPLEEISLRRSGVTS